jgi:putative transposase
LSSKTITASRNQIIRLLGLSRSAYFYRSSQPSKDELLKGQILSVLASNPSYGHRRIALALNLNRKKVRRVMKLYGIKPYKRKRGWRKRRDERRPEATFPNLVKGICPVMPDLIWATDFTYLRFNSRFVYLCTFMDLYAREIVGWSLSGRHTKQLIFNAFFDAFQNKGLVPNIIHSDQGVEYNCKDYVRLMTDLGIAISMSQKASPWENGYQESFYNNFKTDLGLEFDRFDSIGQFVEAVHQTISYYNRQRIHTALKMPPTRFKQQYFQEQDFVEKVV